MLVTFTTKAHADITLFGDIGLAMLKMMGHSATVPGAIPADAVPAALTRLRTGTRLSPWSAWRIGRCRSLIFLPPPHRQTLM